MSEVQTHAEARAALEPARKLLNRVTEVRRDADELLTGPGDLSKHVCLELTLAHEAIYRAELAVLKAVERASKRLSGQRLPVTVANDREHLRGESDPAPRSVDPVDGA